MNDYFINLSIILFLAHAVSDIIMKELTNAAFLFDYLTTMIKNSIKIDKVVSALLLGVIAWVVLF